MTVQDRTPAWLGPYRLLERLGEGGMGIVYLALDASDHKVAVKALRPGVAVEPTARRRLAREVETMRLVHSPNVAEVVDADVTGDSPYIVTQYVAGPTLEHVVAEDGPLTGPALGRLASGLAAALAAVHAAGVVHRDLKPGNVLMLDGEPVVIDFGIAQLPDTTRITMTGMFMGTPGYLAPEVIEGKQSGPASDVHSMAATLAFAATGRPPFGSGTFEAIFYRIVHGQPDLDCCPVALLPMMCRALARDPAARPPAAELARWAGTLAADQLAPSPPGAAARAMTPASLAAGMPPGTGAAGNGSGLAAGYGIPGPAVPGRTIADMPAGAMLPGPGNAAGPAPAGQGPAGAGFGAAGIGAGGGAAGAGLGAAGLGAGGLGAGGAAPGAALALPAGQQGMHQSAGTPGQAVPWQYQTRPLAAGNYRDVLPPVGYPPAAGGGQQPAAAAPGRRPRAAARSPWSPFVLAVLVAAIAVSVAFPVAGTAASLAVLILLRASELTGNLLAGRRSRQASGSADPLVATLYFPLAVLRSAIRLVLLAPLALLAAFLAAAITIMVVAHHPLPLATSLAAGALVAVYCVGPGSAAVRRPLSKCVPASGNPVITAVSFGIVTAVALAAVSLAVPHSPSFWPAPSPRTSLVHYPVLHNVVADVRDSLKRLAGHLG